MSNETSVQDDAGEATSHNESERALRGKIARLPKDIREELNCRLDDGKPASEILPWVNGLPVVKEVLAKHFGGTPINHRNISNWRGGGYQRWVKRQEAVDELTELAEDTQDFFDATGGKVARIAAMKILKLLQTIPAEQSSINDLTKISHAISALLSADQNQARLEYEKTRVYQGNERLVLSWDKFLRGCIDSVQRALKDQIAKDIQAANIDNSEKIELLGYHMFGRKWKGREVGKKEEVAKTEPDETATEKNEVNISGGLPTAATKANPVEPQASVVKNVAEMERPIEKTEGNTSGGLTTAATTPAVPPTPKQKPSTPQRELSQYDKALLEGKTHLEAMYAQAAPVKNVPPKPEDPSVPKPSPWDTFSEPVRPSPFASFHGTMRPSVLG